ncbi:MAG TPA: MG2 domain-containing protein, partial [Armatimonadota bacterium]|nr:MG2 domain-containing protein [Armatimonadota bacterium]
DEPSMAAKNLDLCERCRARFRELYGADLAGPDDVGEDVAARWRLADFLGEYLRAAYQMTREIKEQVGGDYDLLLTFNSPGLGYGRGYTSRQDILSAGAEAGRIDFDIYPYFYPRSQKVRMVQCDFGLSMMREFARQLDMPWGFYVELDDRNWPYQQNPPEASAECAWTALAQGADYLNSFIHTGFGTGTDARPERWEMTGEALRTIRRIGPLLTRMSRPKAPIAMIYPMGQAMVRDGHPPADYAFECIRAGFGMIDAVSSEVLAQQESLADRDCYVLLGCDILEREVAEKLVKASAVGGLIVLDQVPTTDTEGRPLDLPWSFEGRTAMSLPGLEDLKVRVHDNLLKLDFDLNQEYRDAIEGDDFERAAALRRGIADVLLNPLPFTYLADDAAGQMEVGLRLCTDAAIVIVVNHSPEGNSGTIRLSYVGFVPAWACDLATMQRVAIRAYWNGCEIPVTLPGRHSIAIALLPERPVSVDVTVQQAELKPGGTLEYRVRVLDAEGRPAPGCHLLEIEVTGPDGKSVSRFGGSTATEAGVATRSIPVPVNALVGEYRITARAPEADAVARGRFTVGE